MSENQFQIGNFRFQIEATAEEPAGRRRYGFYGAASEIAIYIELANA
jgi:hypothetical protein